MDRYNVTGMSCAACQARVEKAVSTVEGVKECSVNLLTNSMTVEGTVSPHAIIAAVEAAGYGASLWEERDAALTDGESGQDIEIKKMKRRLIVSVILLIPLMYLSMGHMMFNWPLPGFLSENHIGMGLCQLLLAGLILIANRKFFISGFKGLMHGAPNMDTLVSMGSAVAYIYSIYALFSMDQLYFESSAMILTLITVGKLLESKSKGKTTNAIKSLMKLAPKTAVKLEEGIQKTVPIEEVKVGDRFVVKPGDSVPVDGIVIEGESAVNESALTGESVPADKAVGDRVYAATINTSGYLICEATSVGEDTTLAGIIKMVSDAAATKAPIAKIADKVSGVFVPVVILLSVITFIVWFIVGRDLEFAIARAVSVLVISCPCALGLATPVAIMVGNGVGAKNGILFKNAVALEQTGKVQIVALDKTGTITTGMMKVTDVIPIDEGGTEELLRAALALESKSEHPISGAVTEYARERVELLETTEFSILPGNGLKAKIDGEPIWCGNKSYIEEIIGKENIEISKTIDELSREGKTPVLFAKAEKILGIIAVADTIKPDSMEAICELKKMGLWVVMLTGDNEITARAIADQAGVDDVVPSLKPDGKEAVIGELKKQGKVVMVGDGINDAPALTAADIGIAIGAGTDIAIDAADVVLMKNSIADVAGAIKISRSTLRIIHENLFWAFFYNCLGIPLAAGCFTALLGWSLNPMFGAAAMGLSSFCVVTNALRLNFVKITKDIIKEKINDDNREDKKVMKIAVNGMMCEHCEAHVTKALESLDGISNVVASHKENQVTFTNEKNVSESVIKAAVVDAGYEYAGLIE